MYAIDALIVTIGVRVDSADSCFRHTCPGHMSLATLAPGICPKLGRTGRHISTTAAVPDETVE